MDRSSSRLVFHWVGVVLTGYAVQLYWRSILSGTLMPIPYPAIGTALFYTLLFILFLIRKPSQQDNTDRRHALFALAGTFLPFAVVPGVSLPLPAWVLSLSYGIEILGMVLSLVAVSFLGRAFGIFAAHREIKTSGLYRVVRHPLYAGEALWFLSIVLQQFTWFHLLVWVVQVSCQILRLLAEEDLLGQDPTYAQYKQQVRYRLIPGVF